MNTLHLRNKKNILQTYIKYIEKSKKLLTVRQNCFPKKIYKSLYKMSHYTKDILHIQTIQTTVST